VFQELLGRVNLATSATTAALRFNMKDCAGLTIVAIGASSGAVTITESNANTGGTSQTIPYRPYYYDQASGTWSARQLAGSNGTVTLAQSLTAIFIPPGALSDGFRWIAASHASASFVYIAEGLVQRKPGNLRAVNAA